MKKIDANSESNGTFFIHANDLAIAFQFNNENIYDYTGEKMSFGYEMTCVVLSNFNLAMARHFNADTLCEETTINVKFNGKGGFFCTAINPIKGTDKTALSIVVGHMDMKESTAMIDDKEESFGGTFDLFFALTAEVTHDGNLTPDEAIVFVEENGIRNHARLSAEDNFKPLICYADEAFSAIVSDDVPQVDGCQYWLQPDAIVDEQYCYITQRSAEDLAHEIMSVETGLLDILPIAAEPRFH